MFRDRDDMEDIARRVLLDARASVEGRGGLRAVVVYVLDWRAVRMERGPRHITPGAAVVNA